MAKTTGNAEIAEYVIQLRDQFTSGLNNIISRFDQFEGKMARATGGVGGGGGGFIGAFSGSLGVASISAIGLGAALGGLVAKTISLGAELEYTKQSMTTLIGDTEVATEKIKEMLYYAKVTPYSTTDIMKQGQLLLAYGYNVEKLLPTMTMLGDIAMGDADRMSRLTLAFAQTQAAGRLMGQDMLQYVNAGFSPLKEIANIMAQKLGISADVVFPKLREEMKKGHISAEMVSEAFIHATSAGGKYFNAMENGMKTIRGKWNLFTGTIEQTLGSIGEHFSSKIVAVLDVLVGAIEFLTQINWSPLINGIGSLFGALGSLKDSFIEVFSTIFPGLRTLDLFQTAINGIALGVWTIAVPFRALALTIKGIIALFPAMQDGFMATAIAIRAGMTGSLDDAQKSLELFKSAALKGFTAKEDIKAMMMDEAKLFVSLFGTPKGKGEDQKKDYSQIFNSKVFDALFGGAGGEGGSAKRGHKSSADENVHSAGSKNITINIGNLVNEVKVINESLKMTESQIVEIVKRALLTAVNDANVMAK